ncbi:hypothetical protein F7725_006175 [Dissostichus mawsoni]|uniref:Uncharacterized protein n=1 Tax=Dissostichus mawsoni TaxID=36200 RepID=A0A7J5YTP0_DISMA|nr:hypothetical protein F7725_006175 [Dissostichus mawsoni]
MSVFREEPPWSQRWITLTMKKKALRSTTEAHEPEEIELDSDPDYQNDSHTAAQTEDTEEQEDMV